MRKIYKLSLLLHQGFMRPQILALKIREISFQIDKVKCGVATDEGSLYNCQGRAVCRNDGHDSRRS